MDNLYKRIVVNNDEYYFFSEDLEIVKIITKKPNNIPKRLSEEKKENNEEGRTNNLSSVVDAHRLYIGVQLISGCNLNCKYCYITAANKEIRKLSKQKFIGVLDSLQKEKEHNIVFYFVTGGEPTLNYSLLKQIPNLCKENNFNNVSFELTTNGTLLNEEIIQFIKYNNIKLYISFDGDKIVNDESRVYKNGKGIFDDVYNNMLTLKKNNIPFVCKALIQPKKNNMLQAFSFFENANIYYTFDFATDAFDSHYVTHENDLINLPFQLEECFNYYKELILDNKKIYSLRLISDLKKINYGIINKIKCSATIYGYNVDLNGDLYSCAMNSSSKSLSIGDIYHGIDYEKVKKEEYFAKSVDSNPTCKKCWVKYLCSGGCFALNLIKNNNVDIPYDYSCSIEKMYWEAIIKLYIQIYSEIQDEKNINFC